MTTDHNEAMRLAGELVAPIGTQTSYQTAHEAAALLRKQAERIAELEAERTKLVATVAYDTTMVFDLCAERDTLRAEVERLKREKAHAIDKAGHMLAAGMGLSNCAFNLKQRVGEPLSTHDVAALDSAQRAWDTAIDTARKATQ